MDGKEVGSVLNYPAHLSCVDGNFQCFLGILFGGDSGLERKVVVQTTDLHVEHEITRQEPDKTR